MVSLSLTCIFTIVVINHIAHSTGDGTVNNKRSANTDFSSQPLNLDTSPSLATKSDVTSGATSRDFTGMGMLASKQIVAPRYTIDGGAATRGIDWLVFSSRHWKSVVNGKCTRTIAVKGRGISDYMDVPCSAIRDPVMIMFGDWMLIGNPGKDDFSWFSEAWGTSVMVNRGVCSLRQYGVEHGYMKIAVSTISYDECHEAKKRMASKRIGLFDDLKELRENIKHKIGSLLPIRLG